MTRKPITLVCQETSETGKPLQSENREAMHSKLVTETRCIMEHNGTPFYIDLYDGRVQPGNIAYVKYNVNDEVRVRSKGNERLGLNNPKMAHAS